MKQVTLSLIAVIAISVSLGTVYADTDEVKAYINTLNEFRAEPQSFHADGYTSAETILFDGLVPGEGYRALTVYDWQSFSSARTLDTMSIDKRLYHMGDQIIVRAIQDPSDVENVRGYDLFIYFDIDEGPITAYPRYTASTLESGHLNAIITIDEERFEPATCYYVGGKFITDRTYDRQPHRWDGENHRGFCIAGKESRTTALETRTAMLETILTNLQTVIDQIQTVIDQIQTSPVMPAVIIEPTPGSGVPGCENEADGCYIPSIATVDVGGVVIFSNTDNVAHTYTSGSMEEGPSGIFDSGLAIAGSSFEYKADTVGEIPYFCIVHPWMTGVIIVMESTTSQSQTEYVELNVSAFNDDGDGIRQNNETPYTGLPILTYTQETGIADLLITDADGLATKTDLTPNSFYVITLPPEGQVASTNQYTLAGTTYSGVMYVENPSNGSTHTMDVGIKVDPCSIIPAGNVAAVLLGCPTA